MAQGMTENNLHVSLEFLKAVFIDMTLEMLLCFSKALLSASGSFFRGLSPQLLSSLDTFPRSSHPRFYTTQIN